MPRWNVDPYGDVVPHKISLSPAWIQHMRLYPKGGGVSSPDRTGSRVPRGYIICCYTRKGAAYPQRTGPSGDTKIRRVRSRSRLDTTHAAIPERGRRILTGPGLRRHKERTYGHESRLDTTLRLYPKRGRRILTGPGRVTGPAWIQHMRLYPKGGGVSSPDRTDGMKTLTACLAINVECRPSRGCRATVECRPLRGCRAT